MVESCPLRVSADQRSKLADIIWNEMKKRFNPNAGLKGEFQRIGELKLLLHQVDDLFGPIYGLDDDQVKFVKNYDLKYRMDDVNKSDLLSDDIESYDY